MKTKGGKITYIHISEKKKKKKKKTYVKNIFMFNYFQFSVFLFTISTFLQRDHNENIVIGKFCVLSLPYLLYAMYDLFNIFIFVFVSFLTYYFIINVVCIYFHFSWRNITSIQSKTPDTARD